MEELWREPERRAEVGVEGGKTSDSLAIIIATQLQNERLPHSSKPIKATTSKMAKSKRKLPKQPSWSAIPGTKLSVDIDPSNTVQDDDTDDFSKWQSPHYNLEEDDYSAASHDLFDPSKPGFNVEDGAGEFGMFYSLEVISGKMMLGRHLGFCRSCSLHNM